MDLTALQTDALTELINIGYGRAASALSDLTGHRITLEVPHVSMHGIAEVAPMLTDLVQGEVASVNQVFSGPIAGNALLLLDEQAALMLSRLLTDEGVAYGDRIDSGAGEIITEVGNILLNACLGVFGNILNVHVTFAVPRLQVESVERVLRSITIGSAELTHALMVHTRFQLRSSGVSGYMVIILGMTSLEHMLEELEAWDRRSHS
jgi:chemotaxis protein CheC